MKLRTHLGLISILICGAGHSATPPATGTQVTQPARAITGLAAPDFVSVTINLKLDLTGLHPSVTTGGLDCWGLAIGNADAHKSEMAKQGAATLMEGLIWTTNNSSSGDPADSTTLLKTFDRVRSDLSTMMGYPGLDVPGYYGSHAKVSFPVANGAYHGTQSVTFRIGRVEPTDPVTHATLVSPDAFVVCWLVLNGRQALYGRLRQLPDTNNVHLVAAGSAINYIAMTPIPGL